MKVLIVMPKIPKGQEYMFPLGIASVSASLKQGGYQVATLNLNFYKNWEEELVHCIQEQQIDLVATGGLSADYQQLAKVVAVAKRADPRVITVLGGGIVTASPHIILELFADVDIAMQREGERIWPLLMDALENDSSLRTVPNLIFREGDSVVTTPCAKDIEPLDDLPYPDYDGFGYREAMTKIQDSGYWIGDKPAFVLSSRSCPYSCTFCFHTAGKKYRRASLDHVFGEIDHLIRDYNCRDFNFSDELFGLDEKYVLAFCERMRDRHVSWSVSMRVDCITEPMARSMAETGCKWILYGIESADDRILRSMHKNITRAQIDQALALSRKYNLGVIGYLIFGDPEESFESVENSLRWWRENLDMGLGMNMIRAFPGSENYRKCVQSGRIPDEVAFIREGCPLINTTSWSDDDYYRIYAKVEGYKMYYLYAPDTLEILGYEAQSGMFVFRYRCGHCGHSHIARGTLLQKLRLFCSECQQIYTLSLIRYFREAGAAVFRRLLKAGSSVLLEQDQEEHYQLAFALREAAYSVSVRSCGRNLYEHRELWGVETLFPQEADDLAAKPDTVRWVCREADVPTVTEQTLVELFREECGIPIIEKGSALYENENLRKLGISGQY